MKWHQNQGVDEYQGNEVGPSILGSGLHARKGGEASVGHGSRFPLANEVVETMLTSDPQVECLLESTG